MINKNLLDIGFCERSNVGLENNKTKHYKQKK